jgi:hypothetical protein
MGCFKKICVIFNSITVCRIRKFCRYKVKYFSSGMKQEVSPVNIDADIVF